MPFNLLSKTKYITGLQCPRLIWAQIHEPEKIPETDPVTQYVFDQGHLVGELAKMLFPGGIDISADDFMGNISSTKDLLGEREPLFEAGILAGKIYSRVDILSPDLPPKNCTSYNVRKTKPVKRGDLDGKEGLYTGTDYQQVARS